MSLSERLQELRKEHKDSQEQLAEKLGVSRQAISKWESGKGCPDINNVLKISEIYDTSTDYILKGTLPVEPLVAPKKPMDPILKKALSIILIIAGVAAVGIMFITGLALIGRYIF